MEKSQKYQMTTRNAHSFYEISSMLQKAIRRGRYEDAFYAANELVPMYRNYMWKRLFTVSAEDCHDLVSTRVYELKCKDANVMDVRNREYIAEAVGYLVGCRKNRDADYFACNIMNSRDRREICPSIEPTLTEATEVQYPTKNGHGMFDVSSALVRAIHNADYELVGYTANELYVRYKNFLWKTIMMAAKEVCPNHGAALKEIDSLRRIDKEQEGAVNETPIYVAKALVLLVKLVKYDASIFDCRYEYKIADMSYYDDKFLPIPSYVFDCHTYKGKRMGKTKEMFVVEEQKALNPLFECEFDHSPWDRFFELNRIGFYDKDKVTPRPDADTMKAISKGDMQLNLF